MCRVFSIGYHQTRNNKVSNRRCTVNAVNGCFERVVAADQSANIDERNQPETSLNSIYGSTHVRQIILRNHAVNVKRSDTALNTLAINKSFKILFGSAQTLLHACALIARKRCVLYIPKFQVGTDKNKLIFEPDVRTLFCHVHIHLAATRHTPGLCRFAESITVTPVVVIRSRTFINLQNKNIILQVVYDSTVLICRIIYRGHLERSHHDSAVKRHSRILENLYLVS